MGSPLPHVPRVPNQWEAMLRSVALAAEKRKKAPLLDLNEATKQTALRPPGQTATDSYREYLDDVLRRAQEASGGGDGPHPVQVPIAGEPFHTDPATLSGRTLDDFLQSEVYGDDYGKVRDKITSSPLLKGSPLAIKPPEGIKNMDDMLSRRVFEIGEPSMDPSDSFANPRMGIISLGTHNSRIDPVFIRNHEYRHLIAPNHNTTPYNEGMAGYFEHLVESGVPLDLALRAHTHRRYVSQPAEVLPYLGHMMGYEYGLTGKPVLTPEDRIRAVTKWVNSRGTVNKHARDVFDIFGPDPVMQYGPKAGQPATGYETMREYLRSILEPMERSKKQEVIKAMGPLGSVTPKQETMYG